MIGHCLGRMDPVDAREACSGPCIVATARAAVFDMARYTGMGWLICTCRRVLGSTTPLKRTVPSSSNTLHGNLRVLYLKLYFQAHKFEGGLPVCRVNSHNNSQRSNNLKLVSKSVCGVA